MGGRGRGRAALCIVAVAALILLSTQASALPAIAVYNNSSTTQRYYPQYVYWDGSAWSPFGAVLRHSDGMNRIATTWVVDLTVTDANPRTGDVLVGSRYAINTAGDTVTATGNVSFQIFNAITNASRDFIFPYSGQTVYGRSTPDVAVVWNPVSGEALAFYNNTQASVQNADTYLEYRVWDPVRNWSVEMDTPSVQPSGSSSAVFIEGVVARSNPARNETLVAVQAGNRDITLLVRNASNWTNLSVIETDATSAPWAANISFDIAYERSGDEALIAYGERTSTAPRYRIYYSTNGTLSPEYTASSAGADDTLTQFRLVPDPASSNIAMAFLETRGTCTLHAQVWNGTTNTWGPDRLVNSSLTSTCPTTSTSPYPRRSFDVAWDPLGRAHVIYGQGTFDQAGDLRWHSSNESWEGFNQTLPDPASSTTSDEPEHVVLATDSTGREGPLVFYRDTTTQFNAGIFQGDGTWSNLRSPNHGTSTFAWYNNPESATWAYPRLDLRSSAWNISSLSTGSPARFNTTVHSPGNVSEVRMNISYPNGSTLQRSLARAAYNETFYSGSGSAFQTGGVYGIRNSSQSAGPSYFFINVSGTGVNLSARMGAGNDICTTANVSMGFSFNFYGTPYDRVFICNDGYLNFVNSSAVFSNVAIPNTATPNGIVAPFWDDLCHGQGAGGGVFGQTLGEAPNRIFVVQWNVSDFVSGCSTDTYNFEAVLYENSSDIQFNYADVGSRGLANGDSCATATVGIENQTGDGGIQHSFDTASCSNSTAVRFYYPNRYTYVETSTAGHGTYAALNVTARDQFNTWNTTPLSGATFGALEGPPNVTSWGNNATNNATLTFTVDNGTVVRFNGSANQSGTWTWRVNGVVENSSVNATSGTFDRSFSNATLPATFIVNATVNNTNGTSSNVSWTVTAADLSPPVISGLSAAIDNVGGFLRLHVTWTTDEPASGFALVGRDPDLLATRNWSNGSLVTSHNTSAQNGPGGADDPVDDVDYDAVIYYRVRSADAAGNTAWSAVQSVASPSCSGTGGGVATNIVGNVFNSTNLFNATHPGASVNATLKGFARGLELADSILGDSRTPPNQQMFDGRFFWDAGTQWGAGWAKCERAVVLTEVNRTTSNDGANYTAVTHRNLSTNNPMNFDSSLLEKIPDLSPSTGTDHANLSFTSQKDPNGGYLRYTLHRSRNNSSYGHNGTTTYVRIANITQAANSTLSYNDTGIAGGDWYYYLRVVALGNLESESWGNITRAHVTDATPPTGTDISYTGGYHTNTSRPVNFTNGTDAETGINGNLIRSQTATLSSGSCSGWSAVATNFTNVSQPQTVTTTAGRCIAIHLNVSNGDGYWTNVSGPAVMVDTSAPTGGSLSYLNGTNDTGNVTLTFTNASDPESGIGANFLDRRETALSGSNCNAFSNNWTNVTSGIASPYTVTDLTTMKCYEFKMRTRNAAGLNSSDITATDVVKVNITGFVITISSPAPGATLSHAEIPVNTTTTEDILVFRARIQPNAWTNLSSECAGTKACNTTFTVSGNGDYTLEVFANSTTNSTGQTKTRTFTLSVPGTPTALLQETARELASGPMAVSSGGQLKWKLSMNDSNVSTTDGEGGAGALLALAEAYEATGDSALRSAVNNSSNWLLLTNATRTGTTGRWWMQSESAGAVAVRSDLPGGTLGPVQALLRAHLLSGNGSYWSGAKEGLAWLLNNTSVAYNASGSAYTDGTANLSFCVAPSAGACGASSQRDTAMTGAAGAIEVLLDAFNATGNVTYLNAAKSAANWLVSQAVAVGADQAKWPRTLPPPPGGPEYFTGVQEGTAGVVQALLDLHFATSDPAYLDLAVKGGRWLVARQLSSGAWLILDSGSACSTSSSPATPCLTGRDYGAAGVLDTLVGLYNATRTAYGGDSNATVSSLKSAAQSAASWLLQTGTDKAADDADGGGTIDGSGELRWRHDIAADRFYTGDSGETGGAASVLRALGNAYGTFGTDSYRKAVLEGVRRLKSPHACKDADNDFGSGGGGSLRCRDRDSGGEFTSGRNGTAGVLGSMSRLERALRVNITAPNASSGKYPPSQPVLVMFNVSKLLESDAGVAGLASGDVTVHHDGAADSFTDFSNTAGGNYRLTLAGKASSGSHTVWVRIKNGSLKGASVEATYTVGSTHTASAAINRSQAAPGQHFNHTVTVTSAAETPLSVWLVTTYDSAGLTRVSNSSDNVSLSVPAGQSREYNYTFRVEVNGAYTVSTDVGNGSANVTAQASISAGDGPSITSASNNVTGTSATSFDVGAGTGVLFNATSDQAGNWTWKVDGSVVQTNASASAAQYGRNFTSRGVFAVTANVSNANGTSATRTWTVTVVGDPSFSSPSPASPVSDSPGASRTFSVSLNQTATVTWRVNGSLVQTNASVASAAYTNASALAGNWNVSAWAANANGSDQELWTWNVAVPPSTPQEPALVVDYVVLNKSVSYDCPSTPCANATGDDFNLSVRVKNTGGAVAPNVTANRTAHANITRLLAYNNSTLLGGSGSDGILLGNLAPGQFAWANWTLEFSAGPNETYTLDAAAKATNTSNVTNSSSICLVLCAPMTLTVTSATNRTGDSVGLNGYINVTFTVTNGHATRAVNSTNLTAYASASGLRFVRNDSGGTGNWSVIPQIAAGGSASRNFTFQAGAYGAYTVNGQATSPTIGSDTFTDTQAVTTDGPTLTTTATPNRTAVASNQPFNITVTVANSGATAATGVTANVVLGTCPAGATLVSGSANRSLGNLTAGGGSNSTNYTYRLDTPGSSCAFVLYGNNSTQVAAGDTSTATTSPVSSTVLTLDSATPNASDVAVGQLFTIDVTVTNSNACASCANSSLTGVWANITLPSGLRLNNGSNASSVGTLAAGASNTSRFYLVADEAGTHSTVQVNATSANGGSHTGTAGSVTARGPDLRVSAIVPEKVARNSNFNYTLVLENTGAGNANNLTYNVTLPSGVSYAGGAAMNGSVGTLNGTYVTGGSTGQNVSYTLQLNATGAAGPYTLRGYGNATNANGSVSSMVTAENLATGWAVGNLPSSVDAGRPVQLNIRVMNGSNPVNGATVNVTEYNGVGLFAAPTQARATRTTVSGTTNSGGYANLTVVPAPSTLAGYSMRVVASGSANTTPESVLTVNTALAPRGSGPVFSGEDYWSLFTSLPGEIAAAVSKISYLTGTIAAAPAYGGSQNTVTLSGVSTTVNATPSTVDNRVPTTVAVRATQGGSPKANLTVRIVETSGHSLLSGAGQSNGTTQISGVTDASGYANLTITPTRSPWSDWLQGAGSAAFNISVFIGDGSEEKFVMGVTVASGSPATAYVQGTSLLTSALATEISLLKNKVEWVMP
ncbi:MAG: hypothetical protein QXT68_03205 [Halobacteria archaeon]